MSDDFVDESTEEENFADLLESYSSRMKADIQVGDKVKGEIISIGRDTIFVDTGTKIDGLVEKEELLDGTREVSINGKIIVVVEMKPSYLKLKKKELQERVKRAWEFLRSCRICPRKCGINRQKDEKTGFCRMGAEN